MIIPAIGDPPLFIVDSREGDAVGAIDEEVGAKELKAVGVSERVGPAGYDVVGLIVGDGFLVGVLIVGDSVNLTGMHLVVGTLLRIGQISLYG